MFKKDPMPLNFLIEKENKKNKEKFEQKYLYIDNPLPYEKIEKDSDLDKKESVIVIDLF